MDLLRNIAATVEYQKDKLVGDIMREKILPLIPYLEDRRLLEDLLYNTMLNPEKFGNSSVIALLKECHDIANEDARRYRVECGCITYHDQIVKEEDWDNQEEDWDNQEDTQAATNRTKKDHTKNTYDVMTDWELSDYMYKLFTTDEEKRLDDEAAQRLLEEELAQLALQEMEYRINNEVQAYLDKQAGQSLCAQKTPGISVFVTVPAGLRKKKV